MTKHLYIRPAVAEDNFAISRLMVEHAKYEGAPSIKQAEILTALQENKHPLKLFVLKSDTHIWGYMSLVIQYSSWQMQSYLYLDCLYLKAEVRGQGWGKKMMLYVKDFSKQQGLNRVQWQTPIHNQSAIVFYQQLGAIAKAKQRFFWSF